MAKTDMLCPFTHGLCKECSVFRGRHYYLSLCKYYGGYIGEPDATDADVTGHAVDQQVMEYAPAADAQPLDTSGLTLKVVDMETGEARVCGLEETKTWNWGDPTIMRMVDGRQMTGWEKLIEFISCKARKGSHEIVLYEAPRFMLLGGG